VERQQLALDCRRTAEDILAFVAERAGARGGEPRERQTAERTAFHDEFAVRFGDRLQHLIIRLSEAGFSADSLQALSYAGTDRLGARAAAETLRAISDELM
jgi:hypothetical protein